MLLAMTLIAESIPPIRTLVIIMENLFVINGFLPHSLRAASGAAPATKLHPSVSGP
jgi:hypothetical protein